MEEQVLTAHAQAGGVAAHKAALALTGTAGKSGSDTLLDYILHSLDEDSAESVVTIDLHGKSPMADYMVVASGRSSRHVSAIADKLIERLKQERGLLTRSEGKEAGDWVLIDAGDVIVHIFRPEVRDFYQLEKMWQTPADGTARPS